MKTTAILVLLLLVLSALSIAQEERTVSYEVIEEAPREIRVEYDIDYERAYKTSDYEREYAPRPIPRTNMPYPQEKYPRVEDRYPRVEDRRYAPMPRERRYEKGYEPMPREEDLLLEPFFREHEDAFTDREEKEMMSLCGQQEEMAKYMLAKLKEMANNDLTNVCNVKRDDRCLERAEEMCSHRGDCPPNKQEMLKRCLGFNDFNPGRRCKEEWRMNCERVPRAPKNALPNNKRNCK